MAAVIVTLGKTKGVLNKCKWKNINKVVKAKDAETAAWHKCHSNALAGV